MLDFVVEWLHILALAAVFIFLLFGMAAGIFLLGALQGLVP